MGAVCKKDRAYSGVKFAVDRLHVLLFYALAPHHQRGPALLS